MNSGRLVLVLIVSSLLHSQSTTTGTLRGVIIASTGGAVADAAVTLRQLSSSATRTFTTGDAGQFQATGLPIGSYSLRIEKRGFNPVNVDGLTVSVGQTVTQRITLTAGSVTERLEVQEQADALQTSAT